MDSPLGQSRCLAIHGGHIAASSILRSCLVGGVAGTGHIATGPKPGATKALPGVLGWLLASSMVWWWRRKVVVPSYPIDVRVPPFAEWPRIGIVGQIGRGPDQGEWVFVTPLQDPTSGALTEYVLELPRDLYDANSDLIMDDPCVDGPRPDGEGGLIDYLTTALDVEWSTDAIVVAETWTRERPAQ